MEHFVASGKHPPYRACMERVAGADVLLVTVAPPLSVGFRPANPAPATGAGTFAPQTVAGGQFLRISQP
ncbi:MAG TPA: hypothetical protein VNY05_07960 [Candidatus Acidoferrales bacterium]|nr:hypothetical protein [Candidatus Acidoferrales bacterium]